MCRQRLDLLGLGARDGHHQPAGAARLLAWRAGGGGDLLALDVGILEERQDGVGIWKVGHGVADFSRRPPVPQWFRALTRCPAPPTFRGPGAFHRASLPEVTIMTRRLLFSLALAVASSFALTAAVPAYACNGDCDCAKKQTAPKADKKAADPKPADKEAKP